MTKRATGHHRKVRFQLSTEYLIPFHDYPYFQVGHNLHDHLTSDGIVIAIPKSSTDKMYKKKVQDAFEYKESRCGPLASTGPLQCGVFAKTK